MNVSFISLFCFYSALKDDYRLRFSDKGSIGSDLFIIMCFVGCYGRRSVSGLSCRKISELLNAFVSKATLLNAVKKTIWLYDHGYLDRTRITKGSRWWYVYSLSSHAEKLLVKSVGKDELRYMDRYVRDIIKGS